jgi:oxygen-dependent protoporphyrinogen oxidase
VPKRERETIMACTWVATKWLGRVPEGKSVLRCFSTDVEANEPDMRKDLTRLMKITAEPIFSFVSRCPEAMPQYTVGHAARIAELEARMKMIRGIYLAGNAYHGVGIPDCVRGAKEVAKAIVAEL